MTSTTAVSISTSITQEHFYTKPFRAEVVFGNPKRSCQGTGICRIQFVSTVDTKMNCSLGRAWVWPPREGMLRVAFQKQSLCPRVRRRQFVTGNFSLPAAVTLPAFPVAGQLGLPSPEGPTLLPGNYPLRETAALFWVTFRYEYL